MKKKTKTSDDSIKKQFVGFSLDNEIYGLDIMMAESIERVSNITRVPKTQDYVLGVTNIRGDIVPIINLRLRLGMEDVEYDEDTRIIILRFENYRIGMIVDRVNDVFSVSDANIQIGKDIFKDRRNELIAEVIKLQETYILVLDLMKVLDLTE